MTQLSVNKKIIETVLTGNETVGDIVDLVLNQYSNPQDIITDIKLDDMEVETSNQDEFFQETSTKFNKIHISIKKREDLAFEALESASEYLDHIIRKTQDLSEQIKNEEDYNDKFIEVIDGIDLFVQLMTSVHQALRFNTNMKINNLTLKELQIHLLSILKALIPAKQKHDLIMLSDLLEYELIDNLTQWKINAIPALRKYQV